MPARSVVLGRSAVALLALGLGFGGAPVAVPGAAAAPRAAVVEPPGCYGQGGIDLGGDDHTDVPVGEPRGTAGTVADAGVVEVRYGCSSAAPQKLRLPQPHRGDRFGAALAGGYYLQDYDVVRVLFVGVPRLDVKGHKNAGGVAEYHGSPTGMSFVKLWTQDSPGVPGKVQSGAHFGSALSLSTMDTEKFHLRIGEPGLDVGHAKDTGGYVTLTWDEDPGESTVNTKTTLSDVGVRAQDGDLFGSSFSEVGVGAPGRRVDGHKGAGAVLTEDGNGARTLLTQATPGIAGAPETGDHFGATLSGRWIGIPGEGIGSADGAGAIQSYDPDDPASPASTAVTQETSGVPGSVGSGHHFGAALATDDDSSVNGGPDVRYVFVGAPGDRSGFGSVTMLRTPAGAAFAGDAASVPPPSQAGGHFGAAVAESGYGHLVAGAPDADGGRAFSYALPSKASGTPSLVTSWGEAGSGPRDGAGYGATLSGPELSRP